MNNLTKGLLSTVLVFAIVVGIPAAVAGVNNRLIGARDPTVQADNLLTATYNFTHENGTSDYADSSSLTYSVGDENHVFTVNVPDENVSDGGSDSVVLKFNKPEAQTIIDQGIIRLYHEIVTVDNYENIELKVQMAGGTGTLTIYDNTALSGNSFTNLYPFMPDYKEKNEWLKEHSPKLVFSEEDY